MLGRQQSAGLPVIVVGNVIAGGAGKTPVTQAVVAHLNARGWQPAIISRGYGRSIESGQDCREALPDSVIVSVGHRSTLDTFHDRVLELQGEGRWTVTESVR